MKSKEIDEKLKQVKKIDLMELPHAIILAAYNKAARNIYAPNNADLDYFPEEDEFIDTVTTDFDREIESRKETINADYKNELYALAEGFESTDDVPRDVFEKMKGVKKTRDERMSALVDGLKETRLHFYEELNKLVDEVFTKENKPITKEGNPLPSKPIVVRINDDKPFYSYMLVSNGSVLLATNNNGGIKFSTIYDEKTDGRYFANVLMNMSMRINSHNPKPLTFEDEDIDE